MSEINPRTDTSIVNTDIGMRLYSFLANFEMFLYSRSLNCFDFRRLDSWHTDELKIASVGSNEVKSLSKCRSNDFFFAVDPVGECFKNSVVAGFVFFQHLR